MFDLFGIKARQETQEHIKVINDLKDAIHAKDLIIELQAQKIENLKNEVTWFGNDIDFPNSRK